MSKDNLKERRFYQLVEYLNEKEIDQFNIFLESPLHGNNKRLSAFFEAFYAEVLQNPSPSVSPAHLFSILEPGKPFGPKEGKRINRVLNKLTTQFFQYLSLIRSQGAPLAQSVFLIEEMIERGMVKHIPRIYQKLVDEGGTRNGRIVYQSMLEVEMLMNTWKTENAGFNTDTHLQQVLDRLDRVYLLEKLKYGCAALNETIVTKQHYETQFLGYLLEYVDQTCDEQPSVIQAYYHAYKIIQNLSVPSKQDHATYHLLKSLILSADDIEPIELSDLTTYALNYCAIQIQRGNTHFFLEARELNDSLINSEALLVKGLLSPKYYKNIVAVYCRFKDYDRAEEFTEAYKDRLSYDSNGAAYLFNRSVVLFHRGSYAEVSKLLYFNLNLFRDVVFGFTARVYLCKSLYETELEKGFVLLPSALEAFRVYLGRKESLDDSEKKNYKVFIRLFKSLIRHLTSPSHKVTGLLQAMKLKMQQSGEDRLFPWLFKKIEEQLPEK